MPKKPNLKAMMDKLATLVDEVIELQKIEDEAPNPPGFAQKVDDFRWTDEYLFAKQLDQARADYYNKRHPEKELYLFSKSSRFDGKCKTRRNYPAKTKAGKKLQGLAQEVWDLVRDIEWNLNLVRLYRAEKKILATLEQWDEMISLCKKLKRQVKKAFPKVNTEGLTAEIYAQHWPIMKVYSVLDTESLSKHKKWAVAAIFPQAVGS